jgi:benzoyl-CoA reductase/2-hydroxyglutaryl-CoA dehydratase subunit BcrC/BadD/HgdB
MDKAPASTSSPCCSGSVPGDVSPGACDALAWFDAMTANCLAYAEQARAAGRPIVGILCEFTPRELIMAAGAVPVCLCGGSAATIPAAEEHLPSNLCPLIKSTYGYSVLGSNPFLEMAALVVAETTCDGKKKMYELLSERYPMHILELPQKPRRAANLEQWEAALRALRRALEERFGRPITDEALRGAIVAMNRERRLRRALAALMQRECPPFTGRQLLKLKSSISGFAEELERLEEALRYYQGAEGPAAHGRRVRVLMTGVPTVQGAEWVLELVEARGGLVVCLENCTGLKPIVEDVDEGAADPVGALAAKYYHLPCSVMSPNEDRFHLLRQLAVDYRPQCVIELVWQACITYEVESHMVKRLVEEELGLPYLRIVTDYSVADSARIAVRVEALFESVQQRQRPTRP